MRLRELTPHMGPIPIVIPLKIFLDLLWGLLPRLKFTPGSEAWRIETKETYHSLLAAQDDFRCFMPLSLSAKYEF